MSSNEITQILDRCKLAAVQCQAKEEIYKIEEELNRIKKIDLTFKGVKIA